MSTRTVWRIERRRTADSPWDRVTESGSRAGALRTYDGMVAAVHEGDLRLLRVLTFTNATWDDMVEEIEATTEPPRRRE